MSIFDFTPTQVDIDWAKSTMALIRNGGVLAYPATGLIYGVDQTEKYLKLLNEQGTMEDFENRLLHWKTMVTFGKIGYGVRASHELTLRIYADRFAYHCAECAVCSRNNKRTCAEGKVLRKDFYEELKRPTSD